MHRRLLALYTLMTMGTLFAFAADRSEPPTKLSAAEIVDRNVSARGGADAWRKVQTISLTGRMGAGGNRRVQLAAPLTTGKHSAQPAAEPTPQVEEVLLPFIMELKRPRKTRIELQFNGQTAIQVFDGTNGWKLRPFLNRREVEPYTAEELKMASLQADIDGPLVDYAAKGTQVELAGVETVEGRDTYKLKLTLKNGAVIHVWIDAKTYLEAKIDGQPRRLDGTYHPVEIYYRDYRQVSGLQIPYVLETKVLPVAQRSQRFKEPPAPPEKIVIDKVSVNPKLEEALFSKPQVGPASATSNK